MAFFNLNSPVYKTAASPKVATYAPATSSSWLSGLFGSLFTGAVPSYKMAPPPVSTTAAADNLDDAGDAHDACASAPTETIVVL